MIVPKKVSFNPVPCTLNPVVVVVVVVADDVPKVRKYTGWGAL